MKIVVLVHEQSRSKATLVLEVAPRDLLKALLSQMQQIPFEKWQKVEHGFCQPPGGRYLLDLLSMDQKQEISDVATLRAVPTLTVKLTDFAGEWVTVRWFWPSEWRGKDAPPNDIPDIGFLFFYRESDNEEFRPVRIPHNCLVNTTTNTITVQHRGTFAEFAASESDWPRMLLAPEIYLARHLSREALKPSDSNSLTMLLRSPHPYKGIGEQLVKMVQAINLALEDVEIPPSSYS